MSPLNALYMTVITLSTVGSGEIRPLHPEGRVFVIFLILFSIANGAFIASVIGQIVVDGQLRAILGRRKMDSRIRKLSNHHILAGYGRVGRQVADEYIKRKIPFVVIDQTEEAAHRLTDEGQLFIRGNATDDDTRRMAGIDSARTLISTLPGEAHNVYLTLTVRDMNKNLHIIARADYEDGEKKLRRAGANHVVSPHVLGGQRMAMASLRPNVVDFMHTTSLGQGGLTIEEIVIPKNSPLDGQTLIESKLKQEYGLTVIGMKKVDKEMIITPGPNTVLNAGDILVLIGQYEDLERLSKSLGWYSSKRFSELPFPEKPVDIRESCGIMKVRVTHRSRWSSLVIPARAV